MSKKKAFNKTVTDKELIVICPKCTGKTEHKVISSVDIEGKEQMESENYYFHWSDHYQIIECYGCKEVSFRKEHSNSEEYDEDGPAVYETLYPKRSLDARTIYNFLNVPSNLRRIYKETIDCYNNDNLTLCAAGIRAIVEGLCKVNKVIDGEVEITDKNGNKKIKRSKNLDGKINGLAEKGILTKRSAQTLHEHRFLGNKALHELSLPSKEDLELAIDIAEHVFNDLFEMPEKGNKLRGKRLGGSQAF